MLSNGHWSSCSGVMPSEVKGPEPESSIQSQRMHMVNDSEYDHLFLLCL